MTSIVCKPEIELLKKRLEEIRESTPWNHLIKEEGLTAVDQIELRAFLTNAINRCNKLTKGEKK